MPMSGGQTWEDSLGRQDFAPDCDRDRGLRPPRERRSWPPAGRDGPGAGDLAAVPARGHALAQPDRDRGQASGSTLRRWLTRWAGTGVLAQVHALLVGMLRGHPDLILDTCSVRAKRGGDLTGPNPTDRGKRGTKYHVAVDGDGVPVACVATAANVNDTLVFERLFLAAFAVMARIRTVFADKGYDAEHHRDLCRFFGADAADPQARPAARIGAGQAALAGRAQQCLGAGEQAPRSALRPPRLHHPVAAAEPHASSWLQNASPPILKTASKVEPKRRWCLPQK